MPDRSPPNVPPIRLVPLGRALQLDEQDLTRLSTVTQSDLLLAAQTFRQHADPTFKSLLDAEVEEG